MRPAARSALRRALVLLAVSPALASSAAAFDCPSWNRLAPDEKTARIAAKGRGQVYSDYGTKFTSENRAAMARCMDDFVDRIVADLDDACDRGVGPSELDDIFDNYFLSCVQ